MTPEEVSPRPVGVACVTGMHRSGTSFAAYAVRLLGVSLGTVDQLMAPGPDNPAGYWENCDIKELNDEVLARLGGSWDQPLVLHAGSENALADARAHRVATAVWNRGPVDLEALPAIVREAIRWGWLRRPIDGELLARPRAEAVELRDRPRERRRQERAAQGDPTSDTELFAPGSPTPLDGFKQPEDVGG
jgi:hypothetical protein